MKKKCFVQRRIDMSTLVLCSMIKYGENVQQLQAFYLQHDQYLFSSAQGI